MNASTFARALAYLEPALYEVDGVVAWRNWPPSTMKPAANDRRSVREYQRDFNRHFIVANFLDEVGITEWDAESLVTIAKQWAAIVRDALLVQFPDRSHVVELIGIEGADDEPLEVAVTFFET